MRSGDLTMPEEHTRIEVDSTRDAPLLPGRALARHPRAEGVPGRLQVVGDVMADACFRFAPIARERSLPTSASSRGRYVVATIHREANVFQPRLGRIVDGLNRIDEPVVFPAHPRTARSVWRAGTVASIRMSVSSSRSATSTSHRSRRRPASS